MEQNPARWQFGIDRGGTFTDVVGRGPDGGILCAKLLSDNSEHYPDAAVEGIRRMLGLRPDEPISAEQIESVKMGTTVATNALLERKGERVALVINRGFGDVLRIGTQQRPRLFDLQIVLPEQLYERVVEITGRISARGEEIEPLDLAAVRESLQDVLRQGIPAVAIVCLHGYRYPRHERVIAGIARQLGFTQVSTSHETSQLINLVNRGDTTVADAYLSPVLRRYVEQVRGALPGVPLFFMQSNGGLADATLFQGKNAILSGPAGGSVGAAKVATRAGIGRIIGFDMGGTSTDVTHFAGEFERRFETEVAGVRICVPMMHIYTVAAGGGSICWFDGGRLRVGPESAGANPGPAAYRRGGPLTVTDCNVMVGKIDPDLFPRVFGPRGDLPLDFAVVRSRFAALASDLAARTGDVRTAEEIADGFLRIAVDNMAHAIKHISVERGYDATEYTLCCFGGAAGQHACAVADALGMTRVFIHPLAGVLSAYGMGLADVRALRQQAVEAELSRENLAACESVFADLARTTTAEIAAQGIAAERVLLKRTLHLKYDGTDTTLEIPLDGSAAAGAAAAIPGLIAAFEARYRAQYGFLMPDKALLIEAVAVEAIGAAATAAEAIPAFTPRHGALAPVRTQRVYTGGTWHDAAVYARDDLRPGDRIAGPAVIGE